MNGYKEIVAVQGVFINGSDIVVTGCPDCDDEAHNCDDMGCGSIEHILLRGQLRFAEKGYSEGLQEVRRDG